MPKIAWSFVGLHTTLITRQFGGDSDAVIGRDRNFPGPIGQQFPIPDRGLDVGVF